MNGFNKFYWRIKSLLQLSMFFKRTICGKITKIENIILTPHVSGYSQELRSQMENEAVNKIIQNLVKNKSYKFKSASMVA